MTPESVGVPGNNLVLGKHSGRHALGQALAELGYSRQASSLILSTNAFMKLAESKKKIYDQDLLSLVPMATRQRADCLCNELIRRRAYELGATRPMRFNLTVLPGDGVGPEVTREAVRVLRASSAEFSDGIPVCQEKPIGGAAIRRPRHAAAGKARWLPA